MEIVSCKINGLYFCSWFEDGHYIIEDVEAQKAIHLSDSQLISLVNQLSDLPNGSSIRFFLREMRDDSGA